MAKNVAEVAETNIELTVEVGFDKVIEYMTGYLSADQITDFVIRLEQELCDSDVTRKLYDHFHGEVMKLLD